MDKIFFWMLTAYGLTSILVWGSIFESTRLWIKSKSKFFGELISCTLCTSTWVGFIMSLSIGGLSHNFFDTFSFFNFFFDGMFTAGSVWAINSIVEYFEEKR